MKPLILLTNDDGYLSPGLLALRAAMADVGEAWVLAPDRNWSAASRTRVFHKPLRVSTARLADGTVVHVSNGSPSDCVLLALLGLAPRRPDLIVAGINQGLNVGRDVTYSGTVAAAMEGASAGIPALAVSADIAEDQADYELAASWATQVAQRLLTEHARFPSVLLNLNVPRGHPRGLKVTRLGGKIWSEDLVQGKDPRGRDFYWLTGEMATHPPHNEHDTDVWAVLSGYASLTPLHLDLTAYERIQDLRKWESEAPPAS